MKASFATEANGVTCHYKRNTHIIMGLPRHYNTPNAGMRRARFEVALTSLAGRPYFKNDHQPGWVRPRLIDTSETRQTCLHYIPTLSVPASIVDLWLARWSLHFQESPRAAIPQLSLVLWETPSTGPFPHVPLICALHRVHAALRRL